MRFTLIHRKFSTVISYNANNFCIHDFIHRADDEVELTISLYMGDKKVIISFRLGLEYYTTINTEFINPYNIQLKLLYDDKKSSTTDSKIYLKLDNVTLETL